MCRRHQWQFVLTLTLVVTYWPVASVHAQPAARDTAVQGAVIIDGNFADNPELRRLRVQFDAEPVRMPGQENLHIWSVDASRSEALRDALANLAGANAWRSLDAVDFDFRNIVAPAQEADLTPAQRSTLDALAASRGHRPTVVKTTATPVLSQALRYGLLPVAPSSNLGSSFGMEIAPGRVLTLQGGRGQDEDDSLQVWRGAPVDGGSATLSNDERELSGFITTRNSTIELRPLGNGYAAVLETPRDAQPREESPRFLERAGRSDANGHTNNDAPPGRLNTIDVLVAYTPAAGAGAGLVHKTFGDDPVDVTNRAFADAGLKNIVQLRLTDVVAFNYAETQPWDDMVYGLFNAGQPLHDALQAWREQHRADVVVLIVSRGDWCGEAGSIGPNRDRAFVVVNEQCLSSFSFAHEIGHLFGMRHDRAVDSDNTPFAYGHGFVMSQIFERTIMAWPDACPDCIRVPLWSDPRITYKGIVRGTAQWEDEERVARTTAAQLARFYP